MPRFVTLWGEDELCQEVQWHIYLWEGVGISAAFPMSRVAVMGRGWLPHAPVHGASHVLRSAAVVLLPFSLVQSTRGCRSYEKH